MAFEMYSVAVKLSLINNVSAGLSLISKSLGAAGTDADRLNSKLASIGKQAAIGGAMFAGGVAIAGLFKAPLDAARQYDLAFTKFKTMNLGAEVNRQADGFARSANVLGVSAKDMMASLSESVGLFGNFDLAKKLAPQIAGLNAANSAIFAGKVGHIDEGSTRALMKFIDRRGGTHDEATFMRNLNLAERMVTGSGGFIKFRDLDQFSQMGGTAFRGLSDEGILNMSLLLQEQGGAKAGTSLMSTYQNLIAGRTPKKTMAMLAEYGLGDLKMETHGAVGGKQIKSLVMGNIKNGELLQANPPEWIRSVFLPALSAHGVTGESQVLKATNDLISNRTASNQASIMGTQQLQLIRDANLARNAMGVDQVQKAYADDPNSKFANLTARWNDLLVNLGNAILPTVIGALEKLIPMVQSASAWIDANHESIKAWGKGILLFSGFLMAGGLLNMTIAAGRGFWLLGQALWFVGGQALAPLLPMLARFGTYLVIFAVDFARLVGSFIMATPFVRGLLMAFLSPIKLIGTMLYYFISPLTLLLTPVGAVIAGLAAAALLVWNNWDEISGALKLAWAGIKTGVVQLFHGDLLGAFKSFAHVWLLGWQTIFNTLIAGANAILPASMQLKKFSFADQDGPKPDRMSVPVPGKASMLVQLTSVTHLDGKKIADTVSYHQARDLAKPQTSPQGFDLLRSPVMPGTSSTAYPRG